MTSFHFRLADGRWGYIEAEDKQHARDLITRQYRAVPAHVERK